MAKHLFENSYDVPTLVGMPIRFTDGCEGRISRIDDRFAGIRSVASAAHHHSFEYAWETVAWSYVDKGKPFPIR